MGGVCCRCQHAAFDDQLLQLPPRASASAMSVNFNQFYVPAPLAAASSASPSSDSSSSGSSASLSSPDVHSGRHRAPLSQALANYVSFPFPFVKKPKLRKNPNGKTGNGDKGKSKIPRDGQQQCQASGQRLRGGATPLVGEHWRKTPTGAYVPLTLLELSVRNICTQLLMDQPDVLQGALPTELATSVLQWLRQHHALGKTQFQILAPFLLYEWNLAGQTDVEDSWFDDLPSTPLQHVKNIDVSGCHRLQQLGSEWGRPVVELPSLTIACFQDCTKLSCDSIEMLQFSTKLAQLNLSGCSSVNDGCLKALRGLVHLKSLELAGCRKLTDKGVKHLSKLAELKKLHLGRCVKLTDDAFNGFEAYFPQLQELDVSNCRLSERALQQIGQLVSLQVLVIRGCQDIGDDGMRSLAGLTELTYFDARHCGQVHSIPTEWRQLQVLLLGYTAFAESDAAVLQHLLNLRELELRKCRILKRGFQFISRLPKLERLGLAETALTDAGLLEICNGIPYLRALNISNTEISDAGAVGLAKLKELRILRMDAPGITNRALANLSFLSRLERLDLFGANVTDSGLLHLVPLPNLQELTICGGSIGDRGVGLISKLTTLTSLNLSQNRSIRAKSLFYLRSLTSLRCLNLSNTGISALSLRHLYPLKGLQSLSVYGCSLSQGHIDVLREILPELKCLRCT